MGADRRGAALLVVLIALSATAAGVASIAMLQARAGLNGSLHAARAVLDEQAELLSHWAGVVASEALDRVVLAPGSDTPRVDLLNTQVQLGDEAVELRASAFDRSGMLPLEAAGIDPETSITSLAASRLAGDPDESPARLFPPAYSDDEATNDAPEAILSRIAMPIHVRKTTSGAPQRVVNVATATPAVLEAVLDATGDAGFTEQVLEMRSSGVWRPISRSVQIPEWGSRAVRVSSTSSAWALLIEVRSGSISSRWWVELVQTGSVWSPGPRVRITE